MAADGKSGPPCKQVPKSDRQISISAQRAKSQKRLDIRPRSPHMINELDISSSR
jgi:hypothetical protein